MSKLLTIFSDNLSLTDFVIGSGPSEFVRSSRDQPVRASQQRKNR